MMRFGVGLTYDVWTMNSEYRMKSPNTWAYRAITRRVTSERILGLPLGALKNFL